MKLSNIFLTIVLVMLLIGSLQVAYSENVTQGNSNTIQAKNEITKDAVNLQDDIKDNKEDSADIKNDRQALRDAIQSKDKDKIQKAQDKLHKDITSAGNEKNSVTKKSKSHGFKKHHGKSQMKPGTDY